MYSESSKLERPSHRLPLDSFHDAEGLPIPHSFDSRPERPKIVTGDEDDYDPHTTTFASPDIDQKISHRILVEESTDLIRPNTPGYDFYSSPAVSSTYDPSDMSFSPAAMFLSGFSPSSTPQRLPDAEGEFVSGYKLGPVIGYGGFSTIRRASSASGGTVAVKIVRRSDIAKQADPALIRKRLNNEASIWSSLSHEHILPLFSTVHTSHADFFVTLYCPAGSLFDILKRDGRPALMQDDAGMMFRQVVRGLRYLHEVAQLVHRDIKLENVLVDEMGVCRIGDFGMTRNIGDLDADEDDLLEMQQQLEEGQHHQGGERRATFVQSKRQTKPGLPVHLSMIRHHSGPRHRKSTPAETSSTPAQPAHSFQPGSLPYAAPELLMPHFSTPVRVNPAQDIWALGVMLYAMLTGRLPFVDSFEPRLQMKILHGGYDVPQGIGRGAELVLQGCLDRSTSSRWSIAMIDEVAWDIGWNVEGSASAPDKEMIESMNRPHRSASRSNSRSRCRVEASGLGFGSGTPSLDAARRRSTSRARRSQSRASVLGDRSRTTSRSASRPSRHSPPPSYSALADSIHSATSSSLSVPYDRHHESALATSLFLDRGRRVNKVDDIRSASRSPSPSMVPATPTDFVGGRELPPLDDVAEAETSRGRKAFIRQVLTPRPVDPYAREEPDEADGHSRWISDHRKGGGLLSGLSRRLNPLTYLCDESRGRDRSGNIIRPGSTPPNEDATSLRFPDSQGVGGFLREGSLSLGVPTGNPVRSRSTGYDGVRL